jgi:hypothetical protein
LKNIKLAYQNQNQFNNSKLSEAAAANELGNSPLDKVDRIA